MAESLVDLDFTAAPFVTRPEPVQDLKLPQKPLCRS